MKFIIEFVDWLLVRDYYREGQDASDRIVSRQSRGNVLAQNNAVMDADGLDRLACSANQAMQSLAEKRRKYA